MTVQDDIKPVLTDEEILAVGAFGPSPLKRLEHGRAIEQAVLRVLATREGRQQWRPIETAPDDQEVLLGWTEWDGAWKAEVGMASWGWRTDRVSNVSRHGRATHWMPLPAPPADAQRTKGDGNA